MLAIPILFLVPALVAFGLALLLPRGGALAAWIVGCLPAAWLAYESRETLANPLTILFIAVMLLAPALAGALSGLWLARRIRARRAARRASDTLAG